MRTLLRLLSTAAVSFTLSSAAAAPVATPATSTGAPESRATAPHAGPQTLLVRIGSVPRRSGGQFVRYLVFQRPGAVASEAVVSAAEASGGNGSTALTIADRLTSAGWEQICTLAAEESPSPATPMRAAVVTPASASSAAAGLRRRCRWRSHPRAATPSAGARSSSAWRSRAPAPRGSRCWT